MSEGQGESQRSDMGLPAYIAFARELRKNLTPEEKILWSLLRNRKLNGFKFLRQPPFLLSKKESHGGFFIADFYCAERKLVVEVDGEIHRLQKNYDQMRDWVMRERGLTVFRISNSDIHRDVSAVISKIERYLNG